jgi:nucleotide-binding universal stress UspA family protein
MQPISSILFPVDFSPRCCAIVPLIKAIAKKLDSKVTLYYAIHLPHGLFALEHAHPFTIDVEAMISNGREELLRFYGASEETVETGAEIGDPVTAKVLHDAACPVWTGTHTEDTESPAHARCESVLCALDLKSGSADLLRHAADFAARFDARVRIVHAVSEALPGGVMAGTSFQGFLTDAAREEIDNIQSSVGTRFDVCPSARPVADWVRETAYHPAADLVVIGRGRLQGTLGRRRTNAYSIIREPPCPVLSF